MLSSKTKIQEILALAPEWQLGAERLANEAGGTTGRDGAIEPLALFERLGARTIFNKVCSMGTDTDRESFLTLLRDYYFQPLSARMLGSNPSLKRFWYQRRVDRTTQGQLAISLSVELSAKLEQALRKHLEKGSEDGFKVLLASYAQRSVHNAVIDYVKNEWQWEKDTLQDVNLDPQQGDPRANVAEEIGYTPENQAISAEQVCQLNELRRRLVRMLDNPDFDQEPLTVVDCMFGLGMTSHSTSGEEMTMRECCDKLGLPGETQARKIARCQVLLDKGLGMIRDMIRTDMPGVAQAWQSDINVNSASRRELNHVLGLTEGEVERLIKGRQYYNLDELVERGVTRSERLSEIAAKGGVAAFIPVDLNSATRRDIIDILGCSKPVSKRIVDDRPFRSMAEMVEKGVIASDDLAGLLEKGAVLKALPGDERRINLNVASEEDLERVGLSLDLARRLIRARPFYTWQELEDFLCVDEATWGIIRDRSSLRIHPA